MKLTKTQRTKAIARYARRHGFYARTVRTVTTLRYAAAYEYATEVLGIEWPKPTVN